ncbi:amidohydrolase family protein [Planosporangium mesophilum]|uniref:Amidohydrolase n=1 Tax=Planosporangium mesophilum TaxID=689768 RepID=A0A8J3WZ86_9ACTN|nr:amidohydrolase family protein [Planosporangium mesophilum]NJC81402.1 amidohydrolase family protein [Planosporangium mesophilum]GII20944.1 amidohydrolase [Planosporangium mesophilum]
MTSRVDAHHHIWDLSVRDQPWLEGEAYAPIRRTFTVDDLAPEAGAAGVSATVLVQTLAVPGETPELLRAAVDHDLVAAVTGWVELTAPSVADDLAALRSRIGGAYLRAIRHPVQDEPDPDWLCRTDVRRGLRAVAEAGLGYELLIRPPQLPAALRAVEELDHVEFVLDHCAKPYIADGVLEPWASQIRRLATHANITCKLSGLVTEADWERWSPESLRPYVDVVVEAFGPDRLMFGSDWPVCLLAGSYGRWVQTVDKLIAQLSPDERTAITGGTARRFYGIPKG